MFLGHPVSSCSRNVQVTLVKKPQLEMISFLKNIKKYYLIHTRTAKDFNLVFPSLHGGSLEIMLTVSLTPVFHIAIILY